MAKVLITGTNSFIGTNFRKFSSFKDVDSISLFKNKPEDIEFSRYDVVLHLAAIVHQSKKIPDEEYYYINRDLCLRVAENAKKSGIKHFVFISTLKVYGESVSTNMVRNEKSECYPDDIYGKSKYEAELALKNLEDGNYSVSIIRSSLVYGEGVKANMLRMIRLIEICPVLPFGNANNNRSFIYIENLVNLIDTIIQKRSSGIFIAIDEKAISTKQLVVFIARYLERNIHLIRLPPFLLNVWNKLSPGTFNRLFGSLEFDNSITISRLNFHYPYSTEEGIRRMVMSYKTSKKQVNIC